MDISIQGARARVRFMQDYRSDKFSERSGKILTLVKVDRMWLIQQEQAGP